MISIERMLHRIQYYWEMDDNKDELSFSSPPTSPTSRSPTMKPTSPKKKVKYSNVCSVVLIPTRQEFKEAGLDLWYKRGEGMTGRWDDDIDH